jgi:hypothetical protein
MDFRADDYFRAALERMRQAREVYLTGESYALSMYCSGLAVECLLRAFRWRSNPTFEGRHDLRELLQASQLLRSDEERMRARRIAEEDVRAQGIELRSAVNEVVVLWHNNLRFASEARLRAWLKSIGRLRGTKGDGVKRSALDLLQAAQTIVNRGTALWTLKRK